jgi:hypothetical protein
VIDLSDRQNLYVRRLNGIENHEIMICGRLFTTKATGVRNVMRPAHCLLLLFVQLTECRSYWRIVGVKYHARRTVLYCVSFVHMRVGVQRSAGAN